jgi:protein TonB
MNRLSRSQVLALALLSLTATSGWAASTAAVADRAPSVVSAVQPVRPRPVMNFGTSGVVEVAFTISADGRVDHVKIHRSTDPLLEAPVLAAIKQWKFTPAVKNGEVVAVQARQSFTFEDPYVNPTSTRDLPAKKPAPQTMIATAK